MKCPSCGVDLTVTIHDLGATTENARALVDIKHPAPTCEGFKPGELATALLGQFEARAAKAERRPSDSGDTIGASRAR